METQLTLILPLIKSNLEKNGHYFLMKQILLILSSFSLITHINAQSFFDMNNMKDEIVKALQSVFDPEIPVSIYELGLIYDIILKENGDVDIIMTLTTPNCPEAQTIPEKVADVVSLVNGVNEVKVQITWDPPWTQDNMTEAAKLELGLI